MLKAALSGGEDPRLLEDARKKYNEIDKELSAKVYELLPYSEKGKTDYLPRVRYIREVRLDEVSVDSFPADDKAIIYKQAVILANRQALPHRIRDRYPVQKAKLQRTLRKSEFYLNRLRVKQVLRENGR